MLFPDLFEANGRNRLSSVEVFCLVAAIYLHDIGIQLYQNSSLQVFCTENSIDSSELANKDIFVRKHHHGLSKFWILDSISNEPKHSISYTGDRELAPYVANICESHGIDFELYDEYTASEAYNGEELRMGLLCTLLSLGDALDCDRRRIEYKKLKNQDVPLDSRVHWMKHHYVHSIQLSNGFLKIFYHFPKCSTSKEEAVYKYYFQRQTKYWIEKCKEIRGRFLFDTSISYDIDEDTRFDPYKEKLTDEEFEYIMAGAIGIVDKQIQALNQFKQQLQAVAGTT